MSKENNHIDEYIRSVDRWLPYTQIKKDKILENLRVEVSEAVQDKKNPDPVFAYGHPYQIAKGLSLGQDWGVQPANWYLRICAFIIDIILVVGICLLYLLSGFFIFFRLQINQIYSLETLDDVIEILESNLGSSGFLLVVVLLILYVIGTFFLYSGYLIIVEKKFSTTPGKKVLGLFVTDVSGVRMTWKQSILRNITKLPGIIEFLPFDVLLGILLKEKCQKEYQRAIEILTETNVSKK